MEKMTIREPAELREYMAITDELKRRGQHPNHKGEYIAVLRGDTGEERDVALWGTEKLLIKLRSYQKKGENLGYLGEKRKKLVLEHGYDTKNAAHLIRLLRMCKEFMQTGVLEVYRAWDRQQLLDIKMGKYSLRWVQEWADLLFEQCKEERDKSPLPEGPNRVAVEKLTVDILKGEL
jgi:predicted NACHT family NTPase